MVGIGSNAFWLIGFISIVTALDVSKVVAMKYSRLVEIMNLEVVMAR